MVHNRYNERETHPNKHINFISALPMPAAEPPYSDEDARQLLRALAAQVRPIMKDHGFAVNSLEEYEYNRVFAGRNWNAGETVELVLRGADSAFVGIPWLLSTFCHELAHIKHMNHGREFQKLWAQLRNEVRALQSRGYFGDGYWSSGSRLADSAPVGGQGIGDYDLPEYVCGGAQTRSRPKSMGRPRRPRQPRAGPSNHTGAQTEKRRKAGSRVTGQGRFTGEGRSLNADIVDEGARARGAGFRKQAGSKRAREERALAVEKRLRTLEGQAGTSKKEQDDFSSETESDSDDDQEVQPETDEHRRRMMQETMQVDELARMRDFTAEFLAESKAESSRARPKTIAEANDANKLQSESSGESDTAPPSGQQRTAVESSRRPAAATDRKGEGASTTFGMKQLVKDEMVQRRRESLGMDKARRLDLQPTGTPPGQSGAGARGLPNSSSIVGYAMPKQSEPGWTCLVCTLENIPQHLACMACNTPRGESTWNAQRA